MSPTSISRVDTVKLSRPASALLVLVNACILWNSVQLTEVFEQLKKEGVEFLPEDFRHISPYALEHIIPYGQYLFDLRRKGRSHAYQAASTLAAQGPAQS